MRNILFKKSNYIPYKEQNESNYIKELLLNVMISHINTSNFSYYYKDTFHSIHIYVFIHNYLLNNTFIKFYYYLNDVGEYIFYYKETIYIYKNIEIVNRAGMIVKYKNTKLIYEKYKSSIKYFNNKYHKYIIYDNNGQIKYLRNIVNRNEYITFFNYLNNNIYRKAHYNLDDYVYGVTLKRISTFHFIKLFI